MSRKITQPVNQVRLTNVAIVRINRCGKRFEVACYRNKVLNYRQGIETDLSEVLQTDRIFTNVSKGLFAKSSDLQNAFQTTDQEDVARTILLKGDLQVSDMERSHQISNTTLEIASMISSKCINPKSNRMYTVGMILEAMKKAEFCVNERRSVKQQFLDCVKLLRRKNVLPIERAKMELLGVFPVMAKEGVVVEELKEVGTDVVVAKEGGGGDGFRVTVFADPSLYRNVDSIIKAAGGRLEIVRQCVREEGDVNLESEVERKGKMSMAEKRDLDAVPLEVRKTQVEEEDEGDIAAVLSQRTDSLEIVDGDTDKDNEEDGEEETAQQPSNTRKTNKKAHKKSKKAKRREKEDAAERTERIRKEELRQEERRVRLGLDASTAEQTSSPGNEEGEEPKKSCNTCGGSFTNAEYRAHFRSDWHRYNLKLKLKGIPPVSEEEFRTCDADAFFEEVV